MDTLGVILGGSGKPECKETAMLVKEWGGVPESTVLVYGIKVPAHEAVFANSSMAIALDYDDCDTVTWTHPTCTTVPVALATAEYRGKASGRELITTVAIGADAMCRLRRVPDYCLPASGWSTTLYTVFGAAVAAGKILELNQEEMRSALGLAYCQAAGGMQGSADGTNDVIARQGFAARGGFLSAILASRGVISGPKDFLEGKAGFYALYYRGINCDLSRLTDKIGDRYEILNVGTKRYPPCYVTHAAITNVLDIMEQNQLSEENISEVLLRVTQEAYDFACAPHEIKYRPKTCEDAMFSIPWNVGTVMLKGDVTLKDLFSIEAIRSPERLRAIDKVKTVVDEDIDREYKQLKLPFCLHIAEVKTKDGKSFSQKRWYAKGWPQMPMTAEEYANKVRDCASFAAKPFSEGRVNQLIEMVENLEQLDDVSPVIELLC